MALKGQIMPKDTEEGTQKKMDFKSKFIQLVAIKDRLCALDDEGEVWERFQYMDGHYKWMKTEMTRHEF